MKNCLVKRARITVLVEMEIYKTDSLLDEASDTIMQIEAGTAFFGLRVAASEVVEVPLSSGFRLFLALYRPFALSRSSGAFEAPKTH